MSRLSQVETFAAVHSTISNPENISLNRAAINVAAKVLGEFGVGVVYIARNGYEELSTGEKVATVHTTRADEDGTVHLTGESNVLALGTEVSVVRAYSSVGMPGWLDDAAPVVNGPAMRDLSRDKFRQTGLFGHYMAGTVFVANGESTNHEALAALAGDTVVIKPNRGASSDLMVVCDKALDKVNETIEALRIARVENGGSGLGFVVQEYDPAAPISGAETLFPEANKLIQEAGDRARPEIRVYNFADTVGGTLTVRPYVMYRLFAGTEANKLFPMDLASVSADILEKATEITSQVLCVTGRKGGLVATDFYKSSTIGGIRVREVNLANPVIGSGIAMRTLPEGLRASVAEHANKGQGMLVAELLATLALGRKVYAE